MASYHVHLSVSSVLGAAYGAAACHFFQLDWGSTFLGAGITAVGGLLPDLDSDSGVPVREMFSLAAVVVPTLLLHRLEHLGFTVEQAIVVMGGLYLLIRFGLSRLFKRFTVHRGIYHSIPAMLVAGLLVFLTFESPDINLRLFLAGGVMLGFLSHLILDELHSVNFHGVKITLNKYAGSALKLFSPSWPATVGIYALLFFLSILAINEVGLAKGIGADNPSRVMRLPPTLPTPPSDLPGIAGDHQ